MARPELEDVQNSLRSYLSTLGRILDRSHGGWADLESLEQFQRACWAALLRTEDRDWQAKLELLLHYARALFSEDDHHRWDVGPVFGVDVLRRKIQRVLISFSVRTARGLPGARPRRAPRASPT